MKPNQLTLPMFPLSIILLPGETTKLYIYEERYKELVKDCLNNQASFVITYVEKGVILDYGCEVKIKRILKTYSHGEMDILIEGTRLFKLLDYTPILSPKLYGAATIEFLSIDQKIQLNNLQDVVVNYFGTVQNQFIDYDTVAGLTVYNVASSLQLTHPEKYHLISAPNQQLHLLNIIKFINHIIHTEHQIKDRFIEN